MFEPKMGVIKVTGKQTEELLEMLNKMFGSEKEAEEKTADSVAGVDEELESALACAKHTKKLYDAHLQVGFTEEQALEIVTAIIMA